MPQFLVSGYLPDNYDPSVEGEAMVGDIDVLNEEMEAAGLGSSPAACNRRATRNHCVSSPAERWSSPMDHTLRPRNTWRLLDTRRSQHG